MAFASAKYRLFTIISTALCFLPSLSSHVLVCIDPVTPMRNPLTLRYLSKNSAVFPKATQLRKSALVPSFLKGLSTAIVKLMSFVFAVSLISATYTIPYIHSYLSSALIFSISFKHSCALSISVILFGLPLG